MRRIAVRAARSVPSEEVKPKEARTSPGLSRVEDVAKLALEFRSLHPEFSPGKYVVSQRALPETSDRTHAPMAYKGTRISSATASAVRVLPVRTNKHQQPLQTMGPRKTHRLQDVHAEQSQVLRPYQRSRRSTRRPRSQVPQGRPLRSPDASKRSSSARRET